MKSELYKQCLERTKKDYPELIEKYREELAQSTSKGEDWYILNSFWGEFMPRAIGTYPSTLFFDDESMMPMPESVQKQFVNMLFADSIKNVDVLFDVDVYTGLEDYDQYIEMPKEEAVNWYNENMFQR